MKNIFSFRIKETSALATSTYGKRVQKSKPQNQSLLGSYTYGEEKVLKQKEKKNNEISAELSDKNK